MLKKISFGVLFALLAVGFYKSSDFTLIISGVAIFLLGMIFMEGGFKAFSGGLLESILKKSTGTLSRSILSGFISTSVVQSSSLISIITISFLSAELIGLRESIGIILGANIGSTTTAWLVSLFGLKVKISAYALPMLTFGVILKFMKSPSSNGAGDILLGLGLLFLGIADMKEGFDTVKQSVDLTQYAMGGYPGVFLYIGVGVVVTVIIQSSAATMALAIAALATAQLSYENALAIAIGSNIGTTITAILGSLAANENGKRLAMAHSIFNIQTTFVAVVLLGPMIVAVDFLSTYLGIASDAYTLKLALFHTLFNIMGVVIMIPFIQRLVSFLNNRFQRIRPEVDKPLYINNDLVKIPSAAISSLIKETEHLLDNAYVILAHGINVHRKDIYSNKESEQAIAESVAKLPIDIEAAYHESIKSLYSDIVAFATHSQDFMSAEDKQQVYDITVANRSIVESIKDIEFMRGNINKYTGHDNRFIREEYNKLRSSLFHTYREIYRLKNENTRDLSRFHMLQLVHREQETLNARRLFTLIKEGNINNKMATSLMNDTAYAYRIAENLINAADILWFKYGTFGGLSLDKKEIRAVIEGRKTANEVK